MNNTKLTKRDFEFVNENATLFDEKFSTKPIGYFKDAWIRFRKNKASVVAAIIIMSLILFSLITPFVSPFELSFLDAKYVNMTPKNFLSSSVINYESNERGYYRRLAVGAGAEDYSGTSFNKISDKGTANVKNLGNISEEKGIGTEFAAVRTVPTIQGAKSDSETGEKKEKSYAFKLDTYLEVGFEYLTVDYIEIQKILDYENENGLKIIYPLIELSNIKNTATAANADYWFMVDGTYNDPVLDPNGNFFSNYKYDSNGDIVYYEMPVGGGSVRIRVLYYNYFLYKNGKAPEFVLGTNSLGQDLLIRLAVGIRTSLLLSIFITSINMMIGAIYGAIAGYYGGAADLIMERVRDILGGMPNLILITLFKLHMVDTGKATSLQAILFAFILTGWLGTAGLVRRQFYRYKSQEYVLAARTLGASDLRIATKHIFPNGIGTIITASVLSIPGFVGAESMLSFLGILDISGRNSASLGALLASGRNALSTYPHILFWPALAISLLMISFNLFGNGLRDAFNPSLRGANEK